MENVMDFLPRQSHYLRGIGYYGAHGAAVIRTGAGRRDAMSQHTSLKAAGRIVAKRNVQKRFERIDKLKADGKWKDGDSATGLPKTKSS